MSLEILCITAGVQENTGENATLVVEVVLLQEFQKIVVVSTLSALTWKVFALSSIRSYVHSFITTQSTSVDWAIGMSWFWLSTLISKPVDVLFVALTTVCLLVSTSFLLDETTTGLHISACVWFSHVLPVTESVQNCITTLSSSVTVMSQIVVVNFGTCIEAELVITGATLSQVVGEVAETEVKLNNEKNGLNIPLNKHNNTQIEILLLYFLFFNKIILRKP